MNKKKKIHYPTREINIDCKEIRFKQYAKVIWVTGLSGSGKTTISILLARRLSELGFFCTTLDGDYIRKNLNKDLSFSELDRFENIRRVAEVSSLFVNCGIIVICSFISPTRNIRAMAKSIIGANRYLEIYINTPIEICEQRDHKGLYIKARSGVITNFTGITSPFDIPEQPFINVSNISPNINHTIDMILQKILPEISCY